MRALCRADQRHGALVQQHPAGDPTQIAIDSPAEKNGNCKVDDPTYNGYARGTDVSYYCDTEGGSSGCRPSGSEKRAL